MRMLFAFVMLLHTYVAEAQEKLLGSPAPAWLIGKADWQNAKPLKLEHLRGKAVLVRWWTAPGCHFCKASAPALNAFHEKFAARGLQVIGFYHHKSDAPLVPAQVKGWTTEFGFKFPVAIDQDWRTLRKWWLSHNERAWTSVTFLIDRKGIIRHIHPGGQYVEGDAAHAALSAAIEKLLAEKD
ncbi:MAG: TlpA family protein disulfide reductase [Pedosphaera sp.]|nr:TlpA family protein disulfide reductase [Pedosphaera sp.]